VLGGKVLDFKSLPGKTSDRELISSRESLILGGNFVRTSCGIEGHAVAIFPCLLSDELALLPSLSDLFELSGSKYRQTARRLHLC
jgi:hypothetical protein